MTSKHEGIKKIVIPVKTGIQEAKDLKQVLDFRIPASAGMIKN
jgi:hypothetical protein